MIKLIAIDLDGTTLKDEFTLHPYNVEVIKKYISLGYKFLIATGRPYRSSKKFYDELGLDTPIINYNGSYIHDVKESDFKTKIITVRKEDVIQIENDLKDYLCNIMCEYEDLVFIHENDEDINSFFWQDGTPVHYGLMKDNLNIDPCTFIIEIKDALDQDKVMSYMERYKDYSCRFWNGRYNRFAEIIPLGVSKADGIRLVCDYLNINYDEVLTIGDAGNDVCMMKEFKKSCAMKNGEEDVINNAKYVTEFDNENAGVGHFLEKYLQNKTVGN